MTSNPQNSYQLIAKYFSGNHTKREIRDYCARPVNIERA